MLVIVGLTLLLACCMAKGGRVVEGWSDAVCTDELMHIGGFWGMVGDELDELPLMMNGASLDINPNAICQFEENVLTDLQCVVHAFMGVGMGGVQDGENLITRLEIAKGPLCSFFSDTETRGRTLKVLQIFAGSQIMQDHQLLLRIINSNMTFEQMRSLATTDADAIRQALSNAEMVRQESANALEQETLRD